MSIEIAGNNQTVKTPQGSYMEHVKQYQLDVMQKLSEVAVRQAVDAAPEVEVAE